MDRETFADRFRRAAQRARDFAQSFLEEELPSQLRFRVELNASYDGNPLHTSERVFPQDSDPWSCAARHSTMRRSPRCRHSPT
jgi:hypothetical protein